MQQRGLSVPAFAALAGVQRPLLAGWLAGVVIPTPGKLRDVAARLGINARVFYGDTDEQRS